MYRKITGPSVLLSFFCWLLVSSSNAETVSQVTIDFSTHGQGPFNSDFYKKDGVRFTEGSLVEFTQGDAALDGPIAATFTQPISSLSVRLAPREQGTADYILTAFDASGGTIARSSVIVTQDTGDPETASFGYFTIGLGVLPRKAKSFTLENRFIRSSFPSNTFIEFGVSSITFTTKKP